MATYSTRFAYEWIRCQIHTHTYKSIFIEFYCLLILWSRNFRKMFNEIQFHSCSLLLIKVSATLVGKKCKVRKHFRLLCACAFFFPLPRLVFLYFIRCFEFFSEFCVSVYSGFSNRLHQIYAITYICACSLG